TLLRVQYAGLLVVALVASVPGLRRSAGRLAGLFDRPREWHFHTLNLGLALAFNVALNDTALWRDYRSLSPHLLLSLLVLVGSRRYALVAVLVLSSAVCSIAFVETARDLWNRQFTFDTAQIEAFA